MKARQHKYVNAFLIWEFTVAFIVKVELVTVLKGQEGEGRMRKMQCWPGHAAPSSGSSVDRWEESWDTLGYLWRLTCKHHTLQGFLLVIQNKCIWHKNLILVQVYFKSFSLGLGNFLWYSFHCKAVVHYLLFEPFLSTLSFILFAVSTVSTLYPYPVVQNFS